MLELLLPRLPVLDSLRPEESRAAMVKSQDIVIAILLIYLIRLTSHELGLAEDADGAGAVLTTLRIVVLLVLDHLDEGIVRVERILMRETGATWARGLLTILHATLVTNHLKFVRSVGSTQGLVLVQQVRRHLAHNAVCVVEAAVLVQIFVVIDYFWTEQEVVLIGRVVSLVAVPEIFRAHEQTHRVLLIVLTDVAIAAFALH